MREARHEKVHTIWLYLYDILKRQNYKDRNEISGFQALAVENSRELLGVMEILYSLVMVVVP